MQQSLQANLRNKLVCLLVCLHDDHTRGRLPYTIKGERCFTSHDLPVHSVNFALRQWHLFDLMSFTVPDMFLLDRLSDMPWFKTGRVGPTWTCFDLIGNGLIIGWGSTLSTAAKQQRPASGACASTWLLKKLHTYFFLPNQADFINMHSPICSDDILKVWAWLVNPSGRSCQSDPIIWPVHLPLYQSTKASLTCPWKTGCKSVFLHSAGLSYSFYPPNFSHLTEREREGKSLVEKTR